MCDPDIILADEPTGNLDSSSSHQIVELLQKLNRDLGKTVVIITHDNEVAARCDRVIRIKDGRVVEGESFEAAERFTDEDENAKQIEDARLRFRTKSVFDYARLSLPDAIKNLKRNLTRTVLTMIGISVGIAAVFSMITLGQFTKEKILTYQKSSNFKFVGLGRTEESERQCDANGRARPARSRQRRVAR